MAKIPLRHSGYDLESFELFGLRFTSQLQRDEDHEPPWESSDGHGVVTDWMDTLDRDEADAQNLRPLSSDHGRTRYYDFAASIRIALKDKWGLGDEEMAKQRAMWEKEPTPEQITHRAVQLDYEYIRDWCQDGWEYVGVIVTLEGTEIDRSLWGIESNAEHYINETIGELAGEIVRTAYVELSAARGKLGELLKQVRKAEKLYAREVATHAATT